MHALEYRKLIKLSGDLAESKDFLQGVITNDINLLEPRVPLYAHILTPQGKIASDIFIYIYQSIIYIDVPGHIAASLLMKLKMYKIGRDLEVELCNNLSVAIQRDPGADEPRVQGFKRCIVDATGAAQDDELYDEYRQKLLEALVPEFDDNVASEKFYPADFSLDQIAGSVNYEKGCYVGQEVTARMKYRGTKRKFLSVVGTDSVAEKAVVVNIYQGKALVLARR